MFILYVTKRWNSISQSFIQRTHHKFGAENKKLLLLEDLAGEELERLIKSFPSPQADVSEVCFKVMQMVELICIPKILLLYERHKYFSIRQLETETFEHFYNRLERQANNCEFESMRNPLLIESLRTGIVDKQMRQDMARSGNYDLQNILEVCRSVCQRQRNLPIINNVDQDSICLEEDAETSKEFHCERTTQSEMEETSTRKSTKGYDEKGAEAIESSEFQVHCDNYMNNISSEEKCSVKRQRCRSKSVKTWMHILDSTIKKKMIPTNLSTCISRSVKENGMFQKDENMKRHKVMGNKRQEVKENVVKSFFLDQEKVGRLKKESLKLVAGVGESKVQPVKDSNSLKCSKCDKTFSKTNLRKHLRRVHNSKMDNGFKCRWCKKGNFRSDYKFRTHVCLSHTGDKPFLCDLCSATFNHYKNLQEHLRRHVHGKDSLCTICGKLMSGKCSLQKHMKLHTAVKSFTCKFCGKAFLTNHPLKVHMRTHTGERPFPCETCDKSFATKLSLTLHQRTHTGEKPYHCQVCDYRTPHASSLVTHQHIHTKERPFVCHICGHTFKVSSQLTSHMSSHTGECQFECHLCDKRYRGRGALSGHLKRRHPEAPKRCLAAKVSDACKKLVTVNQPNASFLAVSLV